MVQWPDSNKKRHKKSNSANFTWIQISQQFSKKHDIPFEIIIIPISISRHAVPVLYTRCPYGPTILQITTIEGNTAFLKE